VSRDEDEHPLAETAADIASGGIAALAGLAVAGPYGTVEGALAGAAAGPAVKASLEQFLSRYWKRRESRVAFVIKVAAEYAGVRVDSLLNRIGQEPEREQLLIRTLQAAQDEAQLQHLVALGISLGNADRSGYSEEQLTFETAFARALADCDDSHIKLLRELLRYEEPSSDGYISTQGMGARDLELARQELQLGGTLDYLLSVLDRVGLTRVETVDRPSPPFASRTENYWRISDFGKEFVKRLDQVATLFEQS